ncbi:MAG: hypothetical protein LQ352_004241, partial [Teloschistes flavicans]
MHYRTLLALALSAATTTTRVFAAPAPVLSSSASPSFSANTTTTTPLLLSPRGSFDNGPYLGSFADIACTGKPSDNAGKLLYGGNYNCLLWHPTTDNIGIMWGTVRALGLDFFLDDKCQNYATKTYWAPEASLDNGHGKANLCLSAKGLGGTPFTAV